MHCLLQQDCCTEEQIRTSICNIFSKWLKDRGGTAAIEEQDIVENLKEYLTQNDYRLDNINSIDDRKVINPIGFKKYENDKTIFYIYPKTFTDEFVHNTLGTSTKVARSFLTAKHILQTYDDGRDMNIKIRGERRMRMVVLYIENSDKKNAT